MYILSELLEGVVFIDRAPLFVGYSAYHLMIYESNLYTSVISIYIEIYCGDKQSLFVRRQKLRKPCTFCILTKGADRPI